eukprot:COSAG05_NODE_100_length_19386_cov_396.467154_9_plen_96_part_00
MRHTSYPRVCVELVIERLIQLQAVSHRSDHFGHHADYNKEYDDRNFLPLDREAPSDEENIEDEFYSSRGVLCHFPTPVFPQARVNRVNRVKATKD